MFLFFFFPSNVIEREENGNFHLATVMIHNLTPLYIFRQASKTHCQGSVVSRGACREGGWMTKVEGFVIRALEFSHLFFSTGDSEICTLRARSSVRSSRGREGAGPLRFRFVALLWPLKLSWTRLLPFLFVTRIERPPPQFALALDYWKQPEQENWGNLACQTFFKRAY